MARSKKGGKAVNATVLFDAKVTQDDFRRLTRHDRDDDNKAKQPSPPKPATTSNVRRDE